ncbi:MAG TPA: hypothetical protein VF177_08475, partial [Anaerolineae bacterium]
MKAKDRDRRRKPAFTAKVNTTVLWFSIFLASAALLLGGCAPDAPNMMDPKGVAAAVIANLG